MCNLYAHLSNQQAITDFVQDIRRINPNVGNLPGQPAIFPDYPAPIVRNRPDGRELAMVRWGMPSSSRALFLSAQKRAAKLEKDGKELDFKALLKLEPDAGTTNVRNIYDPVKRTWNRHWSPYMGVENRCVVPFTSFSEFDHRAVNGKKNGDTWFALDETRPLAFFAGIYVSQYESVRKAKKGLETDDYYGFLTTEPNDVIDPVHSKAMPVILTTPEEVETWLTAPKEYAITLQRPLPDGSLQIVSVGKKSDGLGEPN